MSPLDSSDFKSFESRVFRQIHKYDRLSRPYRSNSPDGVLSLIMAGIVVGSINGYVRHNPNGIVMGILTGALIGGAAAILLLFFFPFSSCIMATLMDLPKRYKQRRSQQLVMTFIERNDVRECLEPALQSASKDIRDIAKAAIPILYSLATSGVISIPRDPEVFAASAIVIARMSTAGFCSEHTKK